MPVIEYGAEGDRIKTKNIQRSTNDYLQDHYFTAQQNFTPDQGRNSGGGNALLGGFPCYVFRTANDDFIDFSFNRPSHWRKGNLRVTLWTSDDGTATNTEEYLMQVQMKGQDVAAASVNLLSLTSTLVVSVAQAGINALEPIKTVFNTTTPVVMGTYFALSLRIKRLESHATDTMNADDAYCYGAKVEYLPSQRQ